MPLLLVSAFTTGGGGTSGRFCVRFPSFSGGAGIDLFVTGGGGGRPLLLGGAGGVEVRL